MDAVWLWGIVGLLLLGFEMASGTLYVLWFGIAALCVALAVYWLPTLNLGVQLFLFAALALGSLAIWKYFYQKNSTDLKIGQSQGDEIGRIGTVIEAISARQNGRIQFAQGVMGSRVWVAIANESIEVGTDARIIGIEGNSLRVQKTS